MVSHTRHFCLLIILLSFFGVEKLHAQDAYTWEDFVQNYLGDEDENEEQLNTLFEELSELHEHPLNINEITQSQLERLPFISEEEIEELLAYIYRNGPMQSLGELELVPKLEYQTRQMLRLFVYAGATQTDDKKLNLKKALRYGRQEVVARMDIPLYQRAGYKHYADSVLEKSPNKKYLGNALYTSLRYQFNYRNQLMFGLSAEKDAGEPFGKAGNGWGYDAYSFHFLLRDVGRVRALALGDYKLSFGEGLVMNTDFTLGTSALLAGTQKARGIKRHASTDEFRYLRGGAITVQIIKSLTVTAFASYRHMDATLNKDSLTVSAIKEDGYHRTPLEMSKKGNLHNTVFGGNVSFRQGGFHAGFTAVYNRYNRDLQPADDLYKRYYARGTKFYSMGVDYGYRHHRFSINGEAARSKGGGLATLNRATFKINSNYQLLVLQRFYSYKFTSTYANTVSDGGAAQNESGLWLGLNATPLARLQCSVYADVFYHPWAKYQVSRSSHGQAFYGQATYRFSRRVSVLFRYKMKTKEKDYTDAATSVKSLAYNTQHRFKLQADFAPSERWFLRTSADYCQVHAKNESVDRGFMFSESATAYFCNKKVQTTLNAALFFTNSYESRLYGYERGLLYTFSFPSYYYHGLRTALTVRADLGSHWMLIGKYGLTDYFNRSTISSSQQLIDSNVKNDIYLQLRYKF